jgi:hypothetical protein
MAGSAQPRQSQPSDHYSDEGDRNRKTIGPRAFVHRLKAVAKVVG